MGDEVAHSLWCAILAEERIPSEDGPTGFHQGALQHRAQRAKEPSSEEWGTKLDANGLKALRGINGPLQWLVSNTRADLAANVSSSASETAHPILASLRTNKLIRQARRGDTLPSNILAISLDQLNPGIFSDDVWGV